MHPVVITEQLKPTDVAFKDFFSSTLGDQDISKLAGKTKSSKHLKAEELVSQGCQIRILRESDFQCIVVAQAVQD